MLNNINFTRIVYIDDIQEDIFSYRIKRISKQISDLTYKTVGKIKNRESGYMEIPINELENIQNKLNLENKVCVPMYKTSSNDYYKVQQNSKKDLYRVQIFNKNNIDIDNHLDMFGYPSCCKTFFNEEWGIDKNLDTTIKMQENTKEKVVKDNITEIKINPYTNMMLRFIGVRPVFHLPCSFDCEETESIQKEIIQLGYKKGFQQEMNWLLELLNLDVKYDSYHATQFIETKYFKIVTNTDYLKEKQIIKLVGGKDIKIPKKELWLENGFTNYSYMEESHRELINFINKRKFNSIIDYGAGNGYLLSKIKQDNKIGIEKKNDFTYSFDNMQIINKDIKDVMNEYKDIDLKLISIYRVIENPDLISKIEEQKNFIIYSYNKNKNDINKFFNLFKKLDFNIEEKNKTIFFYKG